MVIVITSDQFLQRGNELIGFSTFRQKRVSIATNIERFKAHYGSHPSVYAQIWEDLQRTVHPEARINTRALHVDAFLMGIFFLRTYQTETQLSSLFNVCERTIRRVVWLVALKIQALKVEKVSTLMVCHLAKGLIANN